MNCDKILEELWPTLVLPKVSDRMLDDWSCYEFINNGDLVEIEKLLTKGNAQDRLSLLIIALQQNKLYIVEMLTNKYPYNKSELFQVAKSLIDNREVEKFKFMLKKNMIELDVDLYEYIERDLNNWFGKTFDKAECELMEILKNAKRKAKIKNLEL